MLRYALRRLPAAIVTIAVSTIVVFGVIQLAPGDPAAIAAGPEASPATIAAVARQLGLDKPLWRQYVHWLGGLLSGHLGESYATHAPVGTLIATGAGNTLELTAGAVILVILLGGGAGLVLGTTRSRVTEGILSTLTSLAFAVPTYVSGVLLVLVFAVTVQLFPATGNPGLLPDPGTGVKYLVMPAVSLALPAAAIVARFLAASARQVLDQEFVATGLAKGLRRRRILVRHVLPNALPPALTMFGIQVGQMLGGAIVVEAIFGWPGLGQLILTSVVDKDYPVVQDLLLIAVAVYIVIQIITDLIHAAIDPRVRLGET